MNTDFSVRALVVVAFGKALALAYETDQRSPGTQAWLDGVLSASLEGFVFGDELSHNLTDGVWIVDLAWEDQGASDWDPMIRDFDLVVSSSRPATAEEWAAHLADELPWDKIEGWDEEPDPALVEDREELIIEEV